jgi:beta-glucanase (GH16 family)
MNTTMLANKTQLGGEMFYAPTALSALSLRVSARVHGSPGAVAGFFTYKSDTQESDIEILTRDDDHHAHFSNQPTYDDDDDAVIQGSTFNASVPRGASTEQWLTYRLDWLPGLDRSAWYVDGEKAAETDYQVPRQASTLFVDMWGNNGLWSGKMPVGGHAVLEVQWIEMVFNATVEAEAPPGDGVVCTVDEKVGEPVPAAACRAVMGIWLWLLVSVSAAVMLL